MDIRPLRSGDGAPLHESARRPVVGGAKAVVEILRISSGSGTGARRAGQHRASGERSSGGVRNASVWQSAPVTRDDRAEHVHHAHTSYAQ